jgi:hypothetical protein
MLRPFLLIGVGGSGGKTLRIVRHELERRLAQAGWTQPLPRGWQFLHIDVPSHADGNDPDLPAQLPDSSYAGLVAPGLTYKTIDSALVGIGRTAMGDSLAGWRPNPQKVNVPVEKGAGQFRALGRLITVANLKTVKTHIDRAWREMSGAEVTGELQEVSRTLGVPADTKLHSPVAVVVSSIAGGSGAGAVIDICDTLRATGESWASESFGILYAPDVFDYLPEPKRRGVRPNALATISELLAGYWNKQGPSDETTQLLERQGIQAGDVDRIGPRYSFLVGARNEFVAYPTQNDVYRAMGRSLAAWVASPMLQDRMEAYTQGNWAQTAMTVEDNLPLKTTDMETPFTALGSARVSLGRDRFRDYAAEWLARAAVERVLRRHEELRERDDDRTEAALIEDLAQPMFGSFLENAKLEERGEHANDILDALRPADRGATLRTLTDELTQAATASAPDKGRNVAVWRDLILTRLRNDRPDFLDRCEVEHHRQARAWVRHIQERLTSVTATYVAREGAPVTRELLSKLMTEFEHVSVELQQEALKLRRMSSEVAQFVDAQLREAGGDLVPATHPNIRLAVGRGVQGLQWESEALLRDLAVALLPDLAQNFVAPLRDALVSGQQSLSRDDTSDGGRPAVTAMWPQDDDIPKRLRPAPNEFLVDPVDEYPQVFRQQVRRTVSAKGAGSDLVDAVMQVIIGPEDASPGNQRLVERLQDWVPRYTALHASATDTPARAAFGFKLAALQLRRRADDWVAAPSTPIGRYVHESLRDYLDSKHVDPADLARRERQFEAGLIAAVDAAMPLVSISTQVLVQVHNKSTISSEVFTSSIPFPARSRGREIVQRVMESRGRWTPEMEKALSDSPEAAIDLFSVLSEPYEPVVFSSLMAPIASEWGSRSQTAGLRQEFWRWRRARPLTEFVPVSGPIRRAMVRGWFTAGTLNQVRIEDHHAEVFVPSEAGGSGRWMSFPSPLLVDDISADHELLPVILQSLPLALVDVSAEASLAPVAAYRRLRELGEGGGGGFDSYATLSKPLQRWIIDGVVPTGGPLPIASRAGTPDEGPAQRQKLVEDALVAMKDKYQSLFAQVEQRDDPLDVKAAWELRRDIVDAFGDLIRAVRNLEVATTESGGWV